MTIYVTQNENNKQCPIHIDINGRIDLDFSIKAAIEFREKLKKAIDDYLVEEAIEHAEKQIKQATCDHDWEDCGEYLVCTYPECQKEEMKEP